MTPEEFAAGFKFVPGRTLRRVDDNIQPGETVMVQQSSIEVSPEVLAELGFTPDMSQAAFDARWLMLHQRALQLSREEGEQ